MKNFLKENWFKLIASVALIVLTSSVIFYLFVFLPRQELKRAEEQKQQQVFQEQKQKEEQASKRVADEQATQAKAEQDKQLADQKAIEEKAAQAKQSATNKAVAAKQAKLKSCISAMTAAFTYNVSHNGYSEAAQKIYEDGKALCEAENK